MYFDHERLVQITPPLITSSILVGENLLLSDHLPPGTTLVFPEEIRHLIPAALLDLPHFQIKEGERVKELRQKEKIEEFLEMQGTSRTATLAAIGGGAVLDLVGFVASTYLRGIDYLSLPTTLLAMTDAAFGGKTAIDSHRGKNRIGTFYHPKKVLVHISFLQTLPKHLIIEGLSESIKHALLFDSDFFSFIEIHLEGILAKDPLLLAQLVEKSIAIKLRVIE